MKVRSTFVALLLSTSVLFAQETTEWSRHVSAEGRCEIQFPGKPATKGDKVTTQFVLEAHDGKAVYILGITALPQEIAIDNKDVVQKLFDGSREAIKKALAGSKVLTEKETTIAGKPARDIDLDVPGLGLYRARLIVTPQIFYQIVLLGPKDFIEAPAAKKFRESFKFQPEWAAFTSAEGRCEIQFPGKPATKGDKVTTQFVLEAQGGKAVYILGTTTLPMEIAIDNKDVVRKLFDGSRESMKKSLPGSKILSEKDTMVAGNPARDIDVDVPGLGLYRARLIATPQIFYQIVLLGPKDFVDAPEARIFRESFKIKAMRP